MRAAHAHAEQGCHGYCARLARHPLHQPPSLQPHCSSPAGEQPPAAPGGGAPDGGSLLANLGLWGLWAGLAAYAFLVAPNQTPLRDAYFLEKLVGLVGWG